MGHEGKGGISQPRRFAARDDVFVWFRVIPVEILYLCKALLAVRATSKARFAEITFAGEERGGPGLLDRISAKLSYRLIDVMPHSFCYQGHAPDNFLLYCKPRPVFVH